MRRELEETEVRIKSRMSLLTVLFQVLEISAALQRYSIREDYLEVIWRRNGLCRRK